MRTHLRWSYFYLSKLHIRLTTSRRRSRNGLFTTFIFNRKFLASRRRQVCASDSRMDHRSRLRNIEKMEKQKEMQKEREREKDLDFFILVDSSWNHSLGSIVSAIFQPSILFPLSSLPLYFPLWVLSILPASSKFYRSHQTVSKSILDSVSPHLSFSSLAYQLSERVTEHVCGSCRYTYMYVSLVCKYTKDTGVRASVREYLRGVGSTWSTLAAPRCSSIFKTNIIPKNWINRYRFPPTTINTSLAFY